MINRDLSIASFAFHGMLDEGTMDIFGYLESVAYRYNLRYADIWNGFIKSYDLDYLKKIKYAMDEKGLKLANLCCDCAHPWHEDKEELAKLHAMADNCMLAAEVLEAKTVRIDLGVWTNHISEEQLDYVAGKFREYAEIGKRAGFVVGPENHWGASRRFDVQEKMYEAVNHPNYGMMLHLGNWDAIEAPSEQEANQALVAKISDGRADIAIPKLVEAGYVFPVALTEEEKDKNDMAFAGRAVHMHFHAESCKRADVLIPNMINSGYKGIIGIEHHSGRNEYANVAWQIACVNKALAAME